MVKQKGQNRTKSGTSYHILYYPSVDLYRITKSMDMEIVTFLGLER